MDGMNFSIEEVNLSVFSVPMARGKTTTLKMLAGLLHPSAGEASVLGFTSWNAGMG